MLLHINRGSPAVILLNCIAVAGEFPYNSLYLLGEYQTALRQVRAMKKPVELKMKGKEKKFYKKVIVVSGSKETKTIRLSKQGRDVLEYISCYEDGYLEKVKNNISGKTSNVERNHRIAEIIAMMYLAHFEYRTKTLPRIQWEKIKHIIPDDYTTFYNSRLIKAPISDHNSLESNKTNFTRIIGAMFTPDNCFAVYNTRGSKMKWGGRGEYKMLNNLTELARKNAGLNGDVDSAIFFSKDDDAFLKSLAEARKDNIKDFNIELLYRNFYYIPLSKEGVRQLKFFNIENWEEKILDMFFPVETRSKSGELRTYDAMKDGEYFLLFLNSNVSRLLRYKKTTENWGGTFNVICFKHQVDFVNKICENKVNVKYVNLEDIEKRLEVYNGNG